MKKFSDADRKFIQERITNATGIPFLHPHPEFFLRPPSEFHQPPRGPKIAHMDYSACPYPHQVAVWIQPNGDALVMGKTGLN